MTTNEYTKPESISQSRSAYAPHSATTRHRCIDTSPAQWILSEEQEFAAAEASNLSRHPFIKGKLTAPFPDGDIYPLTPSMIGRGTGEFCSRDSLTREEKKKKSRGRAQRIFAQERSRRFVVPGDPELPISRREPWRLAARVQRSSVTIRYRKQEILPKGSVSE
ncbi:hypothetical protein BX600DRAFT_433505 [Xylariales sp. PMI_506]|nr:hypothetical protein BX600DRAFT_433505 [Xylariales sp. PMI_506]